MRKKLFSLAAMVFLAGTLAQFQARPQDSRGKDGHFTDPYTGEDQPDFCDNMAKNTHPCKCNHANEQCSYPQGMPDNTCTTRCRPKACKCVNSCTS